MPGESRSRKRSLWLLLAGGRPVEVGGDVVVEKKQGRVFARANGHGWRGYVTHWCRAGESSWRPIAELPRFSELNPTAQKPSK